MGGVLARWLKHSHLDLFALNLQDPRGDLATKKGRVFQPYRLFPVLVIPSGTGTMLYQQLLYLS